MTTGPFLILSIGVAAAAILLTLNGDPMGAFLAAGWSAICFFRAQLNPDD